MANIDKLQNFVEKERRVLNTLKDPANKDKHRWYIKETLTEMKGEILRDIDSALHDKRVTLARQYNNHNDEIRKEIEELEKERKAIYNFRFNDSAINMKISDYKKIKSYLAQEFKDIKAILKKKNFKDSDEVPAGSAAETPLKEALAKAKKSGKTGAELEREAFNIWYRSGDTRGVHPIKAERWFKSHINDAYGDKRDYPKIHIYVNGSYVATTTWAKTCREAIDKYVEKHPEDKGKVTAHFADSITKDQKYTIKMLVMGNKYKIAEWEASSPEEAKSEFLEQNPSYRNKNVFVDVAPAISDAKIELRMNGRVIGHIEADTLSEAVRRYEEEHPEARGRVNAYMADSIENRQSYRGYTLAIYKNGDVWGYSLSRNGMHILNEGGFDSEDEAFDNGKREVDLRITDARARFKDALTFKAKQLIETAVREARYDYRIAIGFAEDDLRAEREWAWNNPEEVKRYVRQLIDNHTR